MKALLCALVAVLLIQSTHCNAQTASNAKVGKTTASIQQPSMVSLMGESRENVEKVVGQTKDCYEPKSGRHFRGQDECLAARKVYGLIWDVFYRKDTSNEYEIRLSWSADTTSSRLHPTLRLGAVWLILDKPMTIDKLLPSLQEARHLCSSECTIRSENIGKQEIIVFPEKVEDQTLRTASLAANGWAREPEALIWRFGLTCWWEQDNVAHQAPVTDASKIRIEECQIRPYDPSFALGLANKFPGLSPMPIDLGHWTAAQ